MHICAVSRGKGGSSTTSQHLLSSSCHACSRAAPSLWLLLLLTTTLPSRLVSPQMHLRVLENTRRLTEWMATGPRTCTWGLRCPNLGPRSRGPPSARGAGTTACCRGSKVTSATAASRTAPARNASSSSSGSASWRRRWRCAGSRPTKVWRASSRSLSECCPALAYLGPLMETKETRRGQRSWSWGGAARSLCRLEHKHAQVNNNEWRGDTVWQFACLRLCWIIILIWWYKFCETSVWTETNNNRNNVEVL